MEPVTFAAGLVTMLVAHNVADHVLGQSDKDAANKAKPGRVGWYSIVSHVAKYHLFMFFMLLVTCAIFSLPVSVLGFLSAIAFSTVTHAFLDRRWPVKWILENTGSPEFAKMQAPLHGMYLADQGLHWLCLWISAILLAVL
jgi:hypothetical protein